MWDSLFNKVKTMGMNWLGLGKNQKSKSGFLNKAKDTISGVGGWLNSKGLKNTVKNVSEYIPEVGDWYKTGKKYVNMADQYVNQGGLSKKFDRMVGNKKKERAQPTLEKETPKVDKSTDYMGDYDTGGLF